MTGVPPLEIPSSQVNLILVAEVVVGSFVIYRGASGTN